MANSTTDTILIVKRPGEDDDDEPTEIAKVAFGERGRLTLLSANEVFRSALEDVLAAVNAQEELRIKAPPPPEAEPMTLFRRSVTRDDPDLLEAMCDYAEQRYGLQLVQEPAAH